MPAALPESDFRFVYALEDIKDAAGEVVHSKGQQHRVRSVHLFAILKGGLYGVDPPADKKGEARPAVKDVVDEIAFDALPGMTADFKAKLTGVNIVTAGQLANANAEDLAALGIGLKIAEKLIKAAGDAVKGGAA